VANDPRWTRELEHHRRIADRAEAVWNWDSPAGQVRVGRRAQLFVEHAALAPGRRALELGCGTAVFLARAAQSGAELVGLDLTAELLERARGRVGDLPNVRLVRGNAESTPFGPACFDAVYGSSILHHLDLDRALSEVFRLLRPGGRVVFAEPNLMNPQVVVTYLRPFRRYFGSTPDEMAFTRFRASRALERAGFIRVTVRPFDFVHPGLPRPLIPSGVALGRVLESLPLARELSGSLLMEASRP
jgi:SAM-dependent methyltransferase